MIVAVLALVALNVVTLLVAARREARLLDALMTRTPAEYIAAKKASQDAAKPKPRPEAVAEPIDVYTFPIGL